MYLPRGDIRSYRPPPRLVVDRLGLGLDDGE